MADGLIAQRCGRLNLEVMKGRVTEVLAVSDEAILQAMALVWRRLSTLVEPSGAVPLAALLEQAQFRGARVAVVTSGANADPALLSHVLAGGTAAAWLRR